MSKFQDIFEDNFLDDEYVDPLADQYAVDVKKYKSHVIKSENLRFSHVSEYSFMKKMYTEWMFNTCGENEELQDEIEEVTEQLFYWKNEHYRRWENEDDDYYTAVKWYRYYNVLFQNIMEAMCYNDKKIEDFNHSLALIDEAWNTCKR